MSDIDEMRPDSWPASMGRGIGHVFGFGRVMQHGQKYLKQTCSTAQHRSLCTQRKGGPISISTDIGSWVNSTITSLSILIVGKN